MQQRCHLPRTVAEQRKQALSLASKMRLALGQLSANAAAQALRE
jgi:hypothetical protein